MLIRRGRVQINWMIKICLTKKNKKKVITIKGNVKKVFAVQLKQLLNSTNQKKKKKKKPPEKWKISDHSPICKLQSKNYSFNQGNWVSPFSLLSFLCFTNFHSFVVVVIIIVCFLLLYYDQIHSRIPIKKKKHSRIIYL